jgi:hypothetical protein
MSMLFQQELTVPVVDSKVQLKGRVKATVANPFNAAALRAKEKKAIEKVEQMWNPMLQVLSGGVADDSAADHAAHRVKAKAKVCTFLFVFGGSVSERVLFGGTAGQSRILYGCGCQCLSAEGSRPCSTYLF